MTAAVPVLIPVYHKLWQLERCLEALSKQTVPVVPWIHDNSANNLGCTAAYNLGLRQVVEERDRTGAKYTILINQDCYLAPNAVEELTYLMDRTPRCAIAGLKQYASFDEDYIIHGGCTEAYPTGRHLMGRKSLGQCVRTRPMPWVNGGCMIVRLDALATIGLMDEGMFQFGSDSDWCYTARAKGWEVWYCAEAECVHEMELSRNLSGPSAEMFERDTAYWAEKWLKSPLYPFLEKSVLPAPNWPSILHGVMAAKRAGSAPVPDLSEGAAPDESS